MKAYKGFDKNLKCKDQQYEVGKEYNTDKAKLCEFGFHACEYPLDTFGYYPPSDSRYAEVEFDANDEINGDDSKRVGTRIKIDAEIKIKGIVDAAVKFIFDKVDWKNKKKSNTGDQSAATNTGDRSAATNTGDQSAATNTGDQSAATNTGDQSAAEVSGKESVALAMGYDSKARGSLGCFIVLSNWKETNGKYHIINVKSIKVDGIKIKSDTWYKLIDGKFIEDKD